MFLVVKGGRNGDRPKRGPSDLHDFNRRSPYIAYFSISSYFKTFVYYFTTRARLPLLPLYGRVGPGRYIKCPTSDKTTVGELLGHLKGRLANRATAADILIASIRKEGAVGRAEGDEEEGSNSKDGVS